MNQPGNNSKTANWLRDGPATQGPQAPEAAEAANAPQAAEAPDASPLPARVGRYRIERELGRGGYGTVYLALDEQLHRYVAVKIPHRRRARSADEQQASLAEARMLAHFDHPHILPVYDVGETEEGCAYIVSKYVEGSSLAIRLRQSRLAPVEAAAVTAAVAEALHHAHRHNIVHRDVKPGNILLDHDGHIYLADFGLALKEEDFGKISGYAGTPSYMSPEQARGEGHLLDGRSDVFSLGVVLYKCLTRIRPFRGDTLEEVLERILHLEAKPPRQVCDGIPKELERICLRALAKRASERYPTAADMAEDLRQFLLAADAPQTAGLSGPLAAMSQETPGPDGGAAADQPPSRDSTAVQRVVPKGLRSFDRQDAEFFLSLLPGPRDRRGLPESIRFWKARVEATSPEETFRVGVLYGPSGCGKSSLVKAGLLPQLDDTCVTSAYVEAAPQDTELRLLRRLQNDFPQLPRDEPLPDALRRLRRTPAASDGKKVLIVLDQFEQWLHGRSPEAGDELMTALRQCDGTRLSCLLLVRDDFWLALSRLMADLDADMAAGRNVALVDLFDLRHARRVLAAFGRAFETLPADPHQMTDAQQRFLDQAVGSLAEGDKVVCVRLTLLAEMMKGKRWHPAVLRELGGAAGLGAMFLEETFAAATADPRYRQHSAAARAVLKALLPPPGTDIKGHLWSRGELLAVSGYGKHEARFAELLQILDSELRLVTPADPAGWPDQAAEPAAAAGGECYQLTHDYLVPSLREWLGRKQRETRRGRAEIRLAERAQFWSARPEAKQLPSFGEWLTMGVLTRRRDWTETQARMMRAAGRRHLLRAALVAVAAFGLGTAGGEVYQRQHARNLVARLMEADVSGVPEIVVEMASCRNRVEPLLAAAETEDPRRRLNISLARLPQDAGQLPVLRDFLLAGRPAEVRVIRSALRPYAARVTAEFAQVLDDPAEPTGRRFRAACALAAFAASPPRWAEHAESLAAWLVAENTVVVPEWAELFRPLARHLTAPLKQLFTGDRPDWRSAAAVVLADYLDGDVRQLVELNRHSDDTQRAILVDTLRRGGTSATGTSRPASSPGAWPDQLGASTVLPPSPRSPSPRSPSPRSPSPRSPSSRAIELLEQELSRTSAADALEAERAALARQRASAGMALMLLGQPAALWPWLAQLDDPQLRTCLIHGFAPAGVDPGLLLERLRTEADSTLRMALLLSLGDYRDSLLLSRRQRDALLPPLLAAFRADPHPGIHSATEWLLRQLGQAEELSKIERELQGQPPQPAQGWFVTTQGHTMVLIRGPVEFLMGSPAGEEGREKGEVLRREQIERSFAIAAKEVTLAQFRRFWQNFRSGLQGDHNMERPVDRVDMLIAMAYCNWLSEVEGLPRAQWCYEDRGDGQLGLVPDSFERTGYRLPSEREWEYACRAGTTTARHDGFGVDFLARVAWHTHSADRTLQAVGSLKPNGLGLFDVYGNVREWCHTETAAADGVPLPESDDFAYVRGGSISSETRTLRSAYRLGLLARTAMGEYGFRIARTMVFP